ncbi:MAG TPA: ABC transporter ATP-binding protein [Candidatus Paceibacterota bacterium]
MIQTIKLTKSFKNGDIETKVLKGIDFSATEGQFVAIMGRSGAGKSTFLYQMSLLDSPTGGDVILNGTNTKNMGPDEKMKFRLIQFGYVFQDYALLPDLTALENVALPLLMQGFSRRDANKKSKDVLAKMGLAHRVDNLPSQLSGGEQQRVSITRAVAHDPKILFADEPTANLDNESSRKVIEIFKELHKEGQTIIMVTHELEYAKEAQIIVHLDDGKITEITKNRSV